MSKNPNYRNLELGNIMFNNNKNQKYDCPDWIIALLKDIKDKLDIAFWNKYQLEIPSPFENTAGIHEGNCFQVYAYNWSNKKSKSYNFKYKDIEISWYKSLGRDTTINGEYSSEVIIEMYNDIIKEIRSIK
jgi:hypothetical protein